VEFFFRRREGCVWRGMTSGPRTRLTRRNWLKASLISGGALLARFDEIGRPEPSVAGQAGLLAATARNDPFAGGKRLGVADFVNEGPAQMDTAFGTALDGRLFTDLSTLEAQSPVTPTEMG